jgi:hypothetical protein
MVVNLLGRRRSRMAVAEIALLDEKARSRWVVFFAWR